MEEILRMNNKKDVNQLLIIGNGFDLQCGLKSSFKNYFKYVKEKMDNQDKTLLNGNSISLETVLPHSEFYLNYSSFWDCYFLSLELLEKNNDYGWCDVEKQIEMFLTPGKNGSIGGIDADILFNLLFLISLNELSNYNWNDQLNKKIKRIIENENIEQSKKYIIGNIIKKLSYYISLSMEKSVQNSIKGNTNNLDSLISNYKSIFYSYLFIQLEKFEDNLNEYLQSLFQTKEPLILKNNEISVTTHSEKVTKTLRNYMQRFSKLISKLTKDNKYNLLSFNYTYYSELIPAAHSSFLGTTSPATRKICPNDCVIYKNIHGNLNDHIIIGIDESGINEKDPLYKFTKTYRIMGLEDQEESCLSKSIKEITFYGHSLAKADYSYFQSIFDFYHIYDSDVKLIFYYSDYCNNREKCKFETVNRVIELIKIYGNTLNNKDHGKNLLHKLKLENRLLIRELKN